MVNQAHSSPLSPMYRMLIEEEVSGTESDNPTSFSESSTDESLSQSPRESLDSQPVITKTDQVQKKAFIQRNESIKSRVKIAIEAVDESTLREPDDTLSDDESAFIKAPKGKKSGYKIEEFIELVEQGIDDVAEVTKPAVVGLSRMAIECASDGANVYLKQKVKKSCHRLCVPAANVSIDASTTTAKVACLKITPPLIEKSVDTTAKVSKKAARKCLEKSDKCLKEKLNKA